MIHFLFLLCTYLSSLGTSYFTKNYLQLCLLYLLLLSFFPLGLTTSSEFLSTLSIPISCICIIVLILHSFSFFSSGNWLDHFIHLHYLSNHKTTLWGTASRDWMAVQMITHWIILFLCTLACLPIGFLLLQSPIPSHLITLFFFISIWIWNQLFLFLLLSCVTKTSKESYFLSVLMTMPFSLPIYLWILESCKCIELGIFFSLESLALLFLFCIHLYFSPKIACSFLQSK
uniref:ABC transporter channel subunit n=1 Tax=Jakoba libera TaxID=143017 RepID=M4QDF2_JAKLI|nr:ABC transporter channel subunit [Jakoba libera]AGH24195.1 ABC transporter channel subunit [Jakoba libera]